MWSGVLRGCPGDFKDHEARTENDISLGLEKHMVSQKRLNWNFVLSFY